MDMTVNEISKFSFQERHSFEVEARASKYFGLWVAEKLGLDGADAQTYARLVVEENLIEPGFNDVFSYVRRDLEKKSIAFQVSDLYTKLEECLALALRELSSDA